MRCASSRRRWIITLLKPDATEGDIVLHLRGGGRYTSPRFAIPPCYVPLAARDYVGATEGGDGGLFPVGNDATAVKISAVREAVTRGASELDVVMNVSRFLSGEFGHVADELASLTQEVSVVAMNNGS